jgi:hypothetical protein
MVLHKLLLPDSIAWSALGWIGAIWFISVVVDFIGVRIGTKLFGGGRWGMAGASTGAIVGMFFPCPPCFSAPSSARSCPNAASPKKPTANPCSPALAPLSASSSPPPAACSAA